MSLVPAREAGWTTGASCVKVFLEDFAFNMAPVQVSELLRPPGQPDFYATTGLLTFQLARDCLRDMPRRVFHFTNNLYSGPTQWRRSDTLTEIREYELAEDYPALQSSRVPLLC